MRKTYVVYLRCATAATVVATATSVIVQNFYLYMPNYCQ